VFASTSPFNPTPSYAPASKFSLVLAVDRGIPPGPTVLVLTDEEQIIGRSEQAHFRITLPSISRRHVAVWIAAGVVQAKDLGSQHGTYVNYRQVTEPTILRAGDRLSLGRDVHFQLVVEEEEEGQTNNFEPQEIPLPPPGPVSGDLPGPKPDVRTHLEVISGFCSATFKVSSEQELFEQALGHLHQMIPAARCFGMVGRAIETLQVLAQRGEADPPPSKGIMRRVLYSLSDRPFVSSDAQSERGISERSSIVMSNIRSVMCVGLVGGGHCEGMIYVDTLGTDQPFSANDERFLHVIAQITISRLVAMRARTELDALGEELKSRMGSRKVSEVS